jgi:hypothetical protein
MPASEVHKKKKIKNLVVLGLIAGWCVLIWAVTMIRMSGAVAGQ